MPDQLAVVTGTSSGIGAAVAGQLLRNGWRVIGIARRGSVLRDPNFQQLSIDLADVQSAPSRLEQTLGPTLSSSPLTRLALVNNAATTGELRPIEALRAEGVLQTLALNTVLPIWLMGFAVRHSGAGTAVRIVNVSSGAATNAFPGLGAYCSAKAALRMAGMVLAEELESSVAHAASRRDVGILSYEPGVVDTEMQTSIRTTTADDFPWVDTFITYKRQGRLVPANLPAADIVRFLERDAVPVFSEGRYGA